MPRIIIVAMMFTAALFGQTVTGSLTGRVYDPASALVARAIVQVSGVSTGLSRQTETNAEGFYELPYLPPGEYQATVEISGFQAQSARAEIALNRATVLDFHMSVSGLQQAVTVSDAAPAIDTETGQIRRSLDDKAIESIPVPGRNFLTLAQLLPGFQTNPTSGQNNFTLSSGSSVSFNGTGTRGTTFQTDGVANDDNSENQNRQPVNISTIKEFQVLTNNFNAEFGRGSGSVVLVQTKSGTNQYHGEAYWQTANSALNARSYFANAAGSRLDPSTGRMIPNVPKASSKLHRPGAVFGGPILKNKLFFLGSFERKWEPGSIPLTVTLLPQEFRTPQVDPQAPDAAARRSFIQSIIDRYPKDLVPNNPAIGPNAYSANVSRINQNRDITGRVDWNVGNKDMLYTRYQYGDVLIRTAEIVRGINTQQNHRFQNEGITWSHVYTPRTVGEFRFGFGRRRMIVGLIDGDAVPIVSWAIARGPSSLGSAGQFPLKRVQNDFQYVYNVSMQIGEKHTLKFGTDTRRIQLNDQIENRHRGSWSFSSAAPYNALENFVRGVVQTYSQGYGPKINGLRTTEVNLYVQDVYRITRELTLQLGARFEYVGKPNEVNNVIDIGYGSDKYLEPRFGFAYAPSWHSGWLRTLTGGPGRAVVRGGYGIFHGRIFQSLFEQVDAALRFNPPNGALVSRADPEMSVANPLSGYAFVPGPPTAQVLLATADPGLHMPYTQQWNFTIERAMPWRTALSVSYAGNRGIGFLQYNWRNRAQFPVVSTVPVRYSGANFPGILFDKIDPNLFNTTPAPGFISLGQPRTNLRRRDGRYGVDIQSSNNAWTYYNALQTQFTKRLSQGLSLLAGYTWSKNIDTGSEATFVGGGDINAQISETQGARSMRGLSRLDQPHRFVMSSSYQIPFMQSQRGPLGRILGGWQIGNIMTFAAGNPVTVLLNYDLNGDGIGGDRPWLKDPSVFGRSFDNARVDPATGLQFSQARIPASAFYPDVSVAAARAWPWFPGTGFIASAGRNIFRLHGQNHFDAVFAKNVKLFGKDRGHQLQFRAEIFNLFNRVQFDVPALTLVDQGVVGWRINPDFGRITGQRNSPRNMQMMLRYQF